MGKTFIVVRGLPGSGKSSFAEFLAALYGLGAQEPHAQAHVFTTDDFWTADRPFTPALLSEAHKWNRDRCFGAFLNEWPLVILANTACREWEFQDYIDEAVRNGYRVFSLIVENRHGGVNLHNVPEQVVAGMDRHFEIRLFRKTREMVRPTFWGKIRRWVKHVSERISHAAYSTLRANGDQSSRS